MPVGIYVAAAYEDKPLAIRWASDLCTMKLDRNAGAESVFITSRWLDERLAEAKTAAEQAQRADMCLENLRSSDAVLAVGKLSGRSAWAEIFYGLGLRKHVFLERPRVGPGPKAIPLVGHSSVITIVDSTHQVIRELSKRFSMTGV